MAEKPKCWRDLLKSPYMEHSLEKEAAASEAIVGI
jgi:hypothetical protein